MHDGGIWEVKLVSQSNPLRNVFFWITATRLKNQGIECKYGVSSSCCCRPLVKFQDRIVKLIARLHCNIVDEVAFDEN